MALILNIFIEINYIKSEAKSQGISAEEVGA